MKDTIVRILTDERDQARADSTEIAGKFTKACARIRELEAALREMIAWFRSRSGSPEGMLRVSRAEDVLRSTAETKTAHGFCSECLMTGGHKLSCSKAETAPANSWYCTCGRKNTGLMTMCECGASLTATAKETEGK